VRHSFLGFGLRTQQVNNIYETCPEKIIVDVGDCDIFKVSFNLISDRQGNHEQS